MIYVMLADGFEEIEALTFVDIMRRAEIETKTVSVYNNKVVSGAHDINVTPDIMMDDIHDCFDGIVLPGGMPGTINLQKSKELENILLNAYNEKKYIGAICAAPIILGQLNMLSGRTATCFPSFEQYLDGALFKENRVCVSDNIITACGAGAAHDFAFEFVKKIKNSDVANNIRSSMLYDR